MSHGCMEAVIETANSFHNVSRNTRVDMQGLIEYGTSQSTKRNKDYQLIFSSLYICLSLLLCPQPGLTVLSCFFSLSGLFYLTVTYSVIFSFSKIEKKNFAIQRQYVAEQEGPFQCDLKPVGITFCPTEYESENLTKHEGAVLSTHRLTHC